MDLDSIKAKLLLDNHHKMERFCILVILLFMALVAFWGIGMKIKSDREKLYLSDASLYTSTSQFSLTKNKVHLLNMYCDKDHTKSFILMKANGRDGGGPMADLPANADDYAVWMTAEKGSKITGQPKCFIYVFGDTGYIGLYFVDKSGFSDAMYNIILRNTRIIAQGVHPDEKSSDHNKRFNDMQFFANLNGKSAIVAEFLNDDQPSLELIYSELILKDELTEVVANMNSILIEMNDRMYRVHNYASDLNSKGINVPALPVSIAGDFISENVEDTKDNPTEFDPAMVDDLGYLLRSNDYYNITLNYSTEEEKNRLKSKDLYLHTDFVFPGGYQFNYQDLSIRNGVISRLKPDNMTFEEWYDSKAREKSAYNRLVDYSISSSDTWMRSDGTRFVYNASMATANDKEIARLIEQYCTEVNALYKLKKDYQVEQLGQYVRKENASASIADIFTINVRDNNMRIY